MGAREDEIPGGDASLGYATWFVKYGTTRLAGALPNAVRQSFGTWRKDVERQVPKEWWDWAERPGQDRVRQQLALDKEIAPHIGTVGTLRATLGDGTTYGTLLLAILKNEQQPRRHAIRQPTLIGTTAGPASAAATASAPSLIAFKRIMLQLKDAMTVNANSSTDDQALALYQRWEQPLMAYLSDSWVRLGPQWHGVLHQRAEKEVRDFEEYKDMHEAEHSLTTLTHHWLEDRPTSTVFGINVPAINYGHHSLSHFHRNSKHFPSARMGSSPAVLKRW
ncbi:hypothetical protein JCM8547_003795 [Rhodosporidiobolus lusitaniae]